MKLIMRAKHFKGRTYLSTNRCPVAMAAKDAFPEANYVSEAVNRVHVDLKRYPHEEYSYNMFWDDLVVAERAGFGEDIIRELDLIEIV